MQHSRRLSGVRFFNMQNSDRIKKNIKCCIGADFVVRFIFLINGRSLLSITLSSANRAVRRATMEIKCLVVPQKHFFR